MNKCASVSISREKSSGSNSVSTHKLTAGDDWKVPVMALSLRFEWVPSTSVVYSRRSVFLSAPHDRWETCFIKSSLIISFSFLEGGKEEVPSN